MSQKKYYMDVINVLAPLAMFAGGLTIATQFVTPCSQPNLASLLALASELFLGSLAGLLIVFLLLYGFWDTDLIHDGPKPARCCGRNWGRHSLVVAQIVLVGFMMIAAFFVLGVAIIVVGNHWARGFGMGLVFFVFIGAIMVGVMIGRNKYVRVEGCLPGPVDPVPVHDVQRDLTKEQAFALAWFFLLEFVIMVVLVGLGIWQAIDPPSRQCDASSLALQWPSSTIAFSEVNPQTIPPVTYMDVDTVLSITLTEVDTIITKIDGFSAIATTATTPKEYITTTSTILLPSTSSLNSLSPMPAAISTSCFTCMPYKTAPPKFITSTIASVIPCTTKSLLDEWARKARYNLRL